MIYIGLVIFIVSLIALFYVRTNYPYGPLHIICFGFFLRRNIVRLDYANCHINNLMSILVNLLENIRFFLICVILNLGKIYQRN